MKVNNRKIYLSNEINDELKERTLHIDDGVRDDRLIPEGVKFSLDFNRNTVKRINRLMDFLKTGTDDELESYFKNSKEIMDLSSSYNGLMKYSPNNSYFDLYFVEVRKRLSSDEYKLLYLASKDSSISDRNIKEDLDRVHEWKREYVPTENQKRIASSNKYNVVLGAAGTGKTDVAINSYINHASIDNIKSFSIRDDSFITYSEKLASYVTYEIDNFWDDIKNPICKNVFTTKDFFLEVLGSSNINIPGYYLINGIYSLTNDKKLNSNDLLKNRIVNLNSFYNWMNNGYDSLNRSYVPLLNEIIEKNGSDYPYLFFRGIYKGKIINKARDEEIIEFFSSSFNISNNESNELKSLLDDYVDFTEEPGYETFKAWFNIAIKRYNQMFKRINSRFSDLDTLYETFNTYYDFANPVRENKKVLDYYPLFKRELMLIEGYRGNTRKDFEKEIEVLYEVSKAFQSYMDKNHLYDDNDLAYFVIENIDYILDKGIFRNIIVDEFQDMTERQIHTLVRLSYKDDNYGAIHIFGDFEQTINPTFLQQENIETIYMVNGINDYEKQILNSTFRYSEAICRELEALRKKGKELFGTEGEGSYLPLVSNKNRDFETSGNLVTDWSIAEEILDSISKAKNVQNIMYITSDNESKKELINKYRIDPEKVFTISESKGREEDFVIVYKICSSKSKEYESLFSDDYSYSRAARIFYNQLYVGITRCRTNFLELEDENILGEYTLGVLKKLISPLLKENVGLFLEELLSQKVNYYFRARDSFRNLDFLATEENLTFYSKEDYDNLKDALAYIKDYSLNKGSIDKLINLADSYKRKNRFDLARVIYTVLDNLDMLITLDLREGNNIEKYNDSDISRIIINSKNMLNDDDISCFNELGYFKRKKEALEKKIANIRIGA